MYSMTPALNISHSLPYLSSLDDSYNISGATNPGVPHLIHNTTNTLGRYRGTHLGIELVRNLRSWVYWYHPSPWTICYQASDHDASDWMNAYRIDLCILLLYYHPITTSWCPEFRYVRIGSLASSCSWANYRPSPSPSRYKNSGCL